MTIPLFPSNEFVGSHHPNLDHAVDYHELTAILSSQRQFFSKAIVAVGELTEEKARTVVRIGGRKLTGDEIKHGLKQSLEIELNRDVHPTDDGISSTAQSTQANTFRGPKATPAAEYDFCFLLG